MQFNLCTTTFKTAGIIKSRKSDTTKKSDQLIFHISQNAESQFKPWGRQKPWVFFIVGYHSVHKKPYMLTVASKINRVD